MAIPSRAPKTTKGLVNDAGDQKEFKVRRYLPNLLDLGDNVTYNLKLYMTSLSDSTAGTVLKQTKQKIVAWSGVTSDIGISDFSVKNVLGVTEGTHTGTSTTMAFTLTEPNSAGLFEKLHDYTVELELQNYIKVPYYMELTFKGRNPNTSVDEGAIDNRKWVWPIIITKMDINIDSGGSEYKCTAVIHDDLAYTNEYGNLNSDMSITADTVGSFFTQLAFRLSVIDRAERANGQLFSDVWKFEASDKLKKSLIVPQTQDENSSRYASFKGPEDGSNKKGTTIQFNDGTDILRGIDAVLGNTKYYQSRIKNSSTPEGNAKAPDENTGSSLSQLYRVYTDVKVIGWDPGRADYVREFTYTIKDYDVGTLVGNSLENTTTASISNSRLEEYLEKNYLQKRYDYIFTGLNDQILNINLDFNTMWYVGLPRLAGTSTNETDNPQNAARLPEWLPSELLSKKQNSNLLLRSNIRQTNTIGRQQDNGQAKKTFNAVTGKFEATRGSMQVSSKTNEHDGSAGFGIEAPSSDSKNIFSSMFNQLTSADMLTLDMEIKGDPYWLSPAPYTRADTKLRTKDEEFKLHSTSNKLNRDLMFEKNGQLYLIFTARYPSPGQTTGENRTFTKAQAITGVYHVLTVESIFSDGKFTQKLRCVREKIIDLSLITDVGR